MKKFLITIILLLSCIGVFSQTTINPSGTWTAARNIINANFSNVYDSIAVHQLRLSAVDDSIANHLLRLIAVEDSIGELRTSIGSGTGVEVDSSVYATRHYTSSTFATIANPVFTGIQKVSTTDTLATQAYARSVGGGDVSALETRVDSIVDVLTDTANIEAILLVDLDTDTLATKAYARSVGGGGAAGITLNSGTLTLDGNEGTADDITFYTNGDGSYNLPTGGGNLTIMSEVQGWINDSLDKAKVDIRKFDSDTIPLFVFGLGSGHSADTALFNNGRLAGAFYNSGSDTLYVTELRGVLVEGTGTETIDVQVSWHANMRDVSAVNLNTSAITINNMTTGTSDVSFNNNGIPPGRWVWCVLSGASSGNKPTALMLTMTGYRRNRSY